MVYNILILSIAAVCLIPLLDKSNADNVQSRQPSFADKLPTGNW